MDSGLLLKELLSRIISRAKWFLGFKNETVYGGNFFSGEWFDNWKTLAPVLMQLLKIGFKPKRVLDFGCGPGVMIDYLIKNDIETYGYDPSVKAKELYNVNFGKNIEKYISNFQDLLDIIERKKIKILYAIDVLEHMRDEEIINVFNSFKRINHLYLNISREKYIPGHINLKKDKDWISFFKLIDFDFDFEKTNFLRKQYLELRKSPTDLWGKNIFIFNRNNRSDKFK